MYIVRLLARRLETLRGMTIVHVGAHKGQEAAQYNRWGAARVIWIEADPSQLPALQAHLTTSVEAPRSRFARWTGAPETQHEVIEALVGHKDGAETPFHLFSDDGMSNSIFTKAIEGCNDPQPGVNQTGDVLTLKMRRLDTLLPEHGVALDEVDVLTLNIQGAELLALKGATALLTKVHYLETEISKAPFHDGGVALDELERWLNARRFFNKTWLRRPFMSAVFVRS